MSGALTLLLVGNSAGLTANTFDGGIPETDFYGSIIGTGTATTNTCTVVVSGGSGVYSIFWSRISGSTSINISSASAFAVTWNSTFGPVLARTNEWQATVTDTVTGHTTDTPIVNVTLERLS